jgi:hypothetical protein
MLMRADIQSKFLTKTEDTGRFIVFSKRTGKTYAVEPVGVVKTNWGSIDPATGNLMNKKGHDKYRGSIDAEDSLITTENGFENIRMLGAGVSPHHAIDVIDAKYPSV